MATKSDPVPKVATVWETNAVVCQCCRYHRNKPSHCDAYDKSVGRKMDASKCEKFKRR